MSGELYAESSAVLAWLLGEGHGAEVRDALRRAQLVLASDLTLIECRRVIRRAVALGALSEAAGAERRDHLARAAEHWIVLRLGPDIVERAGQPLPAEPIHTLDAIHLATALIARSLVDNLTVLTLDERVRRCASDLAFPLAPSGD